MSHQYQHQYLSRRTFVQLSAIGLCLPAVFNTHAQITVTNTMNKTARFRALSQRSAKAYIQLVLNVLARCHKKHHCNFTTFDAV